MAGEDTPDTQSGTGEDTGAQSGTGTDSGTSQADGAQSGANSGEKDKKEETVSKAELDRVMARMQAADSRASKAENELKALRDKDLPEAEKLKKNFEETAAERDKLQAELQRARIDNAFLKDNTHAWHDPEAALALLAPKMDRVTIDSEGKVTGLRDLLKELAKEKPWMVKTEGNQAGSGGTTPPMNGGRSGTTGPSKDEIQRRLPAMRTRARG